MEAVHENLCRLDRPYPARVRIALGELGLGLRVAFERAELREGEHKQPDFLAKNSSGTVPVPELDNGTQGQPR